MRALSLFSNSEAEPLSAQDTAEITDVLQWISLARGIQNILDDLCYIGEEPSQHLPNIIFRSIYRIFKAEHLNFNRDSSTQLFCQLLSRHLFNGQDRAIPLIEHLQNFNEGNGRTLRQFTTDLTTFTDEQGEFRSQLYNYLKDKIGCLRSLIKHKKISAQAPLASITIGSRSFGEPDKSNIPLIYAVTALDLLCILDAFLQQNKHLVDCKPFRGRTLFMFAAEYDARLCMKALKDHGAKTDAIIKVASTPKSAVTYAFKGAHDRAQHYSVVVKQGYCDRVASFLFAHFNGLKVAFKTDPKDTAMIIAQAVFAYMQDRRRHNYLGVNDNYITYSHKQPNKNYIVEALMQVAINEHDQHRNRLPIDQLINAAQSVQNNKEIEYPNPLERIIGHKTGMPFGKPESAQRILDSLQYFITHPASHDDVQHHPSAVVRSGS